MSAKSKERILTLVTSLLIILFTYAPLSKWANFHDFNNQMMNQPINHKYISLLLYLLPALELLIALCLLVEATRKVGLLTSLALMLLFTGYIILIKVNYYGRIPCSCGGILQKMNWTQHLIFNIIFCFVALIGLVLQWKPISSDQAKPTDHNNSSMHQAVSI